MSRERTEIRRQRADICNEDCLCAYCDAPEACDHARCERTCNGESWVVFGCDNFSVLRGGAA